MSIPRDWPRLGPDDPLHQPAHRKTLERVRAFVLSLPDTAEKIARGHLPVVTVGGKNFCIFWRADERPNVCFAVAPGVQELLVQSDARRYFVPAYMGKRGWVGVRLDGRVDWRALEEAARDAHVAAAPGKVEKVRKARAR